MVVIRGSVDIAGTRGGVNNLNCSFSAWSAAAWLSDVTCGEFGRDRKSLNCMHVDGAGGWLYQEADSLAPEEIEFTPVSEAKPTEQQLEDLRFAWRIVKHVKSNAITVAKDGRLLGMGSGQPNRVKSTEIALEKAADDVQVGTCDLHMPST